MQQGVLGDFYLENLPISLHTIRATARRPSINDQLDLRWTAIDHPIQSPAWDLLTAVLQGSPQICSLIGPSGCGKTSLAFRALSGKLGIFLDFSSLLDPQPADSNLAQYYEDVKCLMRNVHDIHEKIDVRTTVEILSRVLVLRWLFLRIPNMDPLCAFRCQMMPAFGNLVRALVLKLSKTAASRLDLAPIAEHLSSCFPTLLCVVDEAGVANSALSRQSFSSSHTAPTTPAATDQRGLLSALCRVLCNRSFDYHVLLLGTTTSLNHVQTIYSREGKGLGSTVITKFKPWQDRQQVEYLSSIIDVSNLDLGLLRDLTRPRWLEMVVRELYFPGSVYDCEGVPADEVRSTRRRMCKSKAFEEAVTAVRSAVLKWILLPRVRDLCSTPHMRQVALDALADLYVASSVFKRAVLSPTIALRDCDFVDNGFCYLLVQDTLDVEARSITLSAQQADQVLSFCDLRINVRYGWSLAEPLVCEAIRTYFSDHCAATPEMVLSLNALRDIIAQERVSTPAKGNLFEPAFVSVFSHFVSNRSVEDVIRGLWPNISDLPSWCSTVHFPAHFTFASAFQFSASDDPDLLLCAGQLGQLLRPTTSLRPDAIGHLDKHHDLVMAFKCYTSNIPTLTHVDNCRSSDLNRLALSFDGDPTNREWRSRLCNYAKHKQALRLHVVVPRVAGSRGRLNLPPDFIDPDQGPVVDTDGNVLVFVDLSILDKISEDLAGLLREILNRMGKRQSQQHDEIHQAKKLRTTMV
eukprot:GILJ01007702.1.p1 GENE.GILJ01007702.1~~GILJ01007702.1.p1  ORF type:complete len:748 (+),score=43.10 GILJ01007702.1:340-2583(+)